MSKTSKDHLALGENQVFRAGSHIRTEIGGDQTVFNLGELAHEYKLSEAYANVHNLEFRSDKEIKLQNIALLKKSQGDLKPKLAPTGPTKCSLCHVEK